MRRDKELCAYWVAIAHDDRFDRVIALARAKLSESAIEREQMTGVNEFIRTLRTITDNEDGATEFPSAGLIHNVFKEPEIPREEKKE